MGLFDSRALAEEALKNELINEATLIESEFKFLDKLLDKFKTLESSFSAITCLTAIKGRNLALACYSLTLDSLAQEGGAIFRVLIEPIELLKYFYEDPVRADPERINSLPSAGEIGKLTDGPYKPIREYLNEHASHFSLTTESIKHYVDPENMYWKVTQEFDLTVFRTNLEHLFHIMMQLIAATANCLSKSFELDSQHVVDLVVELGNVGDQIFPINEAGSHAATSG